MPDAPEAVWLNGMTVDDVNNTQCITIYRKTGVTHPFRFRIAWALARLAFWIWTK